MNNNISFFFLIDLFIIERPKYFCIHFQLYIEFNKYKDKKYEKLLKIKNIVITKNTIKLANEINKWHKINVNLKT